MHLLNSTRILIFIIIISISISLGSGFIYFNNVFGFNTISSEERNIIFVPDNVTSLSKAIKIVNPNGTIIVNGGKYDEEIIIEKPLRIIGKNNPVLLNMILIRNTRNIEIANVTINILPPGSTLALLTVNSKNITVKDTNILGSGMIISNTSNIEIKNTTFEQSLGPSIKIQNHSRKALIVDCYFKNTYSALLVVNSYNITFTRNIIESYHTSIKLDYGSRNVLIYLNDIISGYAYDYGKDNRWYNNELKIGNYWGFIRNHIDRNGDNIMDEPILINGTCKCYDKYPLVIPFREFISKNLTTSTMENNSINFPNELLFLLLILAGFIIIVTIYILGFNRKRKVV